VDEPLIRIVALTGLLILTSCARDTAGASSVPGPIAEGAELLPVDTATTYCLGAPSERLAVASIANGLAFRTLFPNSGIAPERDAVTEPLIVVVYADGWPGATTVQPGAVPATPAPGHVDVCVETASGAPTLAGNTFVVYGDIPLEGSLISE